MGQRLIAALAMVATLPGRTQGLGYPSCYNPSAMLHRHLNHSEWTLAVIDDVIARGRLDDWKQLRDAAASRTEILDRILRVSEPQLSDPYAQRYHFWNFYVRKQLA